MTELPPYANSCMLSFPRNTAPANLSRRTTSASWAGTRSLKTLLAAVVRTPAVSTRSLSAIGVRWSGPSQRPRLISDSAVRASANAESAVIRMKAFSLALSCSIRARHVLVSSTGETFLARTSSDAAARVSVERFAVPRAFPGGDSANAVIRGSKVPAAPATAHLTNDLRDNRATLIVPLLARNRASMARKGARAKRHATRRSRGLRLEIVLQLLRRAQVLLELGNQVIDQTDHLGI